MRRVSITGRGGAFFLTNGIPQRLCYICNPTVVAFYSAVVCVIHSVACVCFLPRSRGLGEVPV